MKDVRGVTLNVGDTVLYFRTGRYAEVSTCRVVEIRTRVKLVCIKNHTRGSYGANTTGDTCWAERGSLVVCDEGTYNLPVAVGDTALYFKTGRYADLSVVRVVEIRKRVKVTCERALWRSSFGFAVGETGWAETTSIINADNLPNPA